MAQVPNENKETQKGSNKKDPLCLTEYDSDSCDEKFLETAFSTQCSLLTEKRVTRDEDSYILHVTGTTGSDFNVAASTSGNSCDVYHFGNNQLAKIETLDENKSAIVGIKFSPENNELLYTVSIDGYIKLWDLRLKGKEVMQFREEAEDSDVDKTFTCFDVSSNNRLLAAGTELHEGEAFILFWDVRSNKLMGGYWESHTDDITQIKFHPTDYDKVASSSTDGLINTYNLTLTNEEDALLDSLNTDSSVEDIMWYSVKNNDCICCITHTVDIQLWRTDGVEPYAHFRRLDIKQAIKRKAEVHCYIAGAHNYENDDIFVLAGSNWKNGEYVTAARCGPMNKQLDGLFSLKGNKQKVRSSWYNKNHKILVTGGEQGLLNVWSIKG